MGASDGHSQLVVIGAGPGGYTAAFRAADLGLEVTLIERYPALGGVCLNVGCIPSKALLHVADVIEQARALASRGVTFGEPRIELARLREFKDEVVGKLSSGLSQLAARRGVRVVEGTARFAGPHEVIVHPGGPAPERSITFEQAIIAAGSRVVKLPGFPWDDPRVMDSTGALALADVPGRLLIVGGGIIGLEMATVYRALGAEITVVELTDRLIPEADRDLVKPLEKRLRQQGIALRLKTRVLGAEAAPEGLRVRFEGGDEPELFDRALVAVGRRPNGDRLEAAAAGVEVDQRGFIHVDNRQRTNVAHVFAIGDITGGAMLAHKATHEAKVAAEVASGRRSAFDARVIPAVAYTDPEVAWVGLTEEAARAQGRSVGVGRFPWAASGRALGLDRAEGSTKLLFDPESHQVLGGGIVGPHAGDLIAEVALAVELQADAEDLGLTIHPHPTLSETLSFAAEAFEGTITDLYLPKKPR